MAVSLDGSPSRCWSAARLAADNQTLYCLANDGGQQLIYACTPSETSPYGRVLEADFTVRQLEAAGFVGAAFMDKDEIKIFAQQ